MHGEERLPLFRKNLNKIFKDSKKTQDEFSKGIGISRQSLYYYLSGERVPDAITLRKICEGFNVSADWLLGLSNVKIRDADLQAVSRYIELSQETIEALHTYELRKFTDRIPWEAIKLMYAAFLAASSNE